MSYIPGHNAINMMMAITPLMKNSDKIRDMFIDVMRKALYDRDVSTQQMGVHGFCLVLKLIRDNSRRIRSGNSSFSQVTISGFSLASQIIQSNKMRKQRHFDMLALEILGILKKSFNQTSLIKITLYEGLSKAIEFNPKIIPHLVSYLTEHFQQFFRMSDLSFEIKFDKIVRQRSENVFDIWDDLGQLVWLMGRIVILARKNQLDCEIDSTAKTLEIIMNRIDVITAEQLGLVDRLDERTSYVGIQYLNTLEALMGFALHAASKENNYLIKILKLYKHHASILKQLTLANITKKVKKGKNTNATANTSSTKPIQFKPENNWDLPTLERFVQLIYEDNVPFATHNQSSALRTCTDFGSFILRTASEKVEKLQREPQYRQLKHSKSTFANLCQMSRLVFEKCVKCLPQTIQGLDNASIELSVQLFYNCLLAGDTLFKRKFDEFLSTITNQKNQNISQSIKQISQIIQDLIEELVLKDEENDDYTKNIASSFLQCLEVLYSNFTAKDSNLESAFEWLHKICLNYDITTKNMNLIHKLLYNLRMQNDVTPYFECIALQISQILGQHERVVLECEFNLKSIAEEIVESCIIHLCNCLRRQIEFIEYFITKAKSLNAKLNITGLSTAGKCVQTMKSAERKICTQLIQICNAASHLANSCIPFGNSMDQVKRLLIQLYVCLTNITKHLIIRNTLQPVSCQSVQFDQLVRAGGRMLASKTYNMITYVEEKQNPDKVLRETKFLPKLVLRVETFNKYVMSLGKKTKCDLANHLTSGRVRFFRIKDLQDIVDKTIQQCTQTEISDTDLDEVEREDDSLDSDSNVETPTTPSTLSSATSGNIEEMDPKAKLLRNMEKINNNAKRKRNEKEKDTFLSKPSKKSKK